MNYPKYKCHKEVSAVKIDHVEHGSDGTLHVFLRDGFDKVVLPHGHRYNAVEPGSYLVRYSDGYLSFSPAKAFEEGYSALDDTHAEEIADAENDHGQRPSYTDFTDGSFECNGDLYGIGAAYTSQSFQQ